MTTTRVVITTPPSINAMYRNVAKRGRAKSKIYKDWLRTAQWEVIEQRKHITAVHGPYTVAIKVAKGTRGDLDNRIKAAVDLLVTCGVTDDDKHCQKVTIERGELEHYSEIIVSSFTQ